MLISICGLIHFAEWLNGYDGNLDNIRQKRVHSIAVHIAYSPLSNASLNAFSSVDKVLDFGVVFSPSINSKNSELSSPLLIGS